METSPMWSFHTIIIWIISNSFYLKYGGGRLVNESAAIIFLNLWPDMTTYNWTVTPLKTSIEFFKKSLLLHPRWEVMSIHNNTKWRNYPKDNIIPSILLFLCVSNIISIYNLVRNKKKSWGKWGIWGILHQIWTTYPYHESVLLILYDQ